LLQLAEQLEEEAEAKKAATDPRRVLSGVQRGEMWPEERALAALSAEVDRGRDLHRPDPVKEAQLVSMRAEMETLRAVWGEPQWHEQGMVAHAASLVVGLVAAEACDLSEVPIYGESSTEATLR